MKREIIQWKKSAGRETDRCNLSNKRLIRIETPLPDYTMRITKLFLSNNQIGSLQGIEQFPQLSHLSLSNNKLMSFDELTRIVIPSNLTTLNLQGNFLARNPRLLEDIVSYFIKYSSNQHKGG